MADIINNVQEYIEVALADDRAQKVFVVRHSNLVFFNEDNIDKERIEKRGYRVVFHNFSSCIQRPFEPFFDVIKDYLFDKSDSEIDVFFERAHVYSMHRGMIKQYVRGEKCIREEDILLGEFTYEKEKMKASIVGMLSLIASERKIIFVLAETNLAGIFFWDLIKGIMRKEIRMDNIRILSIHNTVGKTFSFSRNRMTETIALCEEEGVVFEWAYGAEGVDNYSRIIEEEQSIDTKLDLLSDSLSLLEAEKSGYWINKLTEAFEDNKIELTTAQELRVHRMSVVINLLRERYSDALFACKKIENVIVEDEKKKKQLKFDVELFRALIQAYNNEKVVAEKHIKKCELIISELDNEKNVFRVELLKNMVQYSGWKDLWISEKDTDVNPQLIEMCKKYHFYNHLAYIYVYSYNSDYRKYTNIDGIWERIPEFNYGIEIAYELGNEKLIDMAYMKNVLLASIHGNFEVCIFFYMKLMENVEKGDDETMEADIYNGLGYSSCGLGRYVESNKYYNNALNIFYKQRNGDKIIETLYNMGINAILAGAYKSAIEYLGGADYILRNMKKNALNCCHISKFYTLLSLSYFYDGVYYQAHTYLNYAKAYLSHVLGKENEREVSFSDDSMFLVYFLDALFAYNKKQYEEALECLDNAEFYMMRSTGALFFNYPQYVIEKHKVLIAMGDFAAAKELIAEGLAYCKEHTFEYYYFKIQAAGNNLPFNIKNDISIHGVTLKDIESWVKSEYIIAKNTDLMDTIDLFQNIQKNISQMTGNIEEELATIIPIYKKKFFFDKAFFIKVYDESIKIEYSDLEFEMSEDSLRYIVDFFKKERREFLLTDKSSIDEKYEEMLEKFSTTRILSFVAVPNFVNDELDAVMISYIEMSEDWLSRRKNSLLEESDLTILSYITQKICDAINKLELTENLIVANNEMKVQMENAKRANEAKSRFLANMSHEIRTPINAIIGMNEMIMRESQNDSVQGFAGDVKSAAKSLLSIINDVLDMSKIESGKLEIFEAEYNFKSMMNDIINMVSVKAQEKNLKFDLELDEKIPTLLFGDDVRVKQIIINLLSNAVKYTKEGTVTLTVSSKNVDGYVDLSIQVRDTGIGIKEEDIGKLFVAFERIEEKRNRNIEGTGLGMNITNSLLDLMKSKLEVESVYGEGSVFSFVLRQRIIDNTPVGKFSEWHKHNTDNSKFKSELYAPDAHILVVDDNDMNRKVFINLLKHTRMQIDQASSGFKCLEMTANTKYDLIFLDHMMPELDGIETFHRMRNDKENACNKVPVVILTANALVGAREQYLEQGFDDYLSKPVVPEKIEKLIINMLPKELLKNKSGEEIQEKIEETIKKVNLSDIPEMDVEYAKTLLRDERLVTQTASDFYKSLDKEIGLLKESLSNISSEAVMDQYRIQVHSLKSSSKMIGMLTLFGLARMCELAARDKDTDRIKVLTPLLIDELLKTKEYLSVFKIEEDSKELVQDESQLKDMLADMLISLETFDLDKLDESISEIRKFRYKEETEKVVELLEEQIRNVLLDDATQTINEFI